MRIGPFEIGRRTKDSAPIKFVGELAKVTFAPGDVFLLLTDAVVSQETARRMAEYWEASMGEDVKCIVLGDGMRVAVLGRDPDAEKVRQALTEDAAEQAIKRLVQTR